MLENFYVATELSKRNIPNSLLPENFDDDLIIGKKSSAKLGWIQVKACYPDRSKTFRVGIDECEKRARAEKNEYVAFVWLGSPKGNDRPIYWITHKAEAGRIGVEYKPKNPNNKERRFAPDVDSTLNPTWKGMRLRRERSNSWDIFGKYKAYA